MRILVAAAVCGASVLCGCQKPAQPAVVITSTGSTRTAAANAPAGTQLPGDFIGTFTAISSTAMGVTGDVHISPSEIRMTGAAVSLNSLLPVNAQEAAALNEAASAQGAAQQSFLAAVQVPGTQKVANGNTLCGREAVTYIAGVASSSKEISLLMFSGAQRPVLTKQALNNTRQLCGTYGYERK